jgi:hypothetical protein
VDRYRVLSPGLVDLRELVPIAKGGMAGVKADASGVIALHSLPKGGLVLLE